MIKLFAGTNATVVVDSPAKNVIVCSPTSNTAVSVVHAIVPISNAEGLTLALKQFGGSVMVIVPPAATLLCVVNENLDNVVVTLELPGVMLTD